jgi:hypothetical protein
MDIRRHNLHGALHVLVFGQLTAPTDRACSLSLSLSLEQKVTACCVASKHPDILSLSQFKFAPLAFVEMGQRSGLGGWQVRHTNPLTPFPPSFSGHQRGSSPIHLKQSL